MEALQTDKQIIPITTIKRHGAAAGRVRHRPRSLTTAGVEVRSSPGTSTPTRNPAQHPVTHTQLGRALKPPDPHRDPGPGRVDHLHHHATVALCDHPTTRAASTAITGLYVEHQSIWGASHAHQMEALQTDEQITPITTIKRRGAAGGRVRRRPRSLTTEGVEVRSSSRTSTYTRNPRSTPTHPHSTLKSPPNRRADHNDHNDQATQDSRR